MSPCAHQCVEVGAWVTLYQVGEFRRGLPGNSAEHNRKGDLAQVAPKIQSKHIQEGISFHLRVICN